MRRQVAGWVGVWLAVAGLAWYGGGPARAAGSPFAGTWKVTLFTPFQDATLWLVQVEDQGGKPQAKVLAAAVPQLNGTAEVVRAEGGALHLKVQAGGGTFAVIGHAPKGEAKSKELLGSWDRGGSGPRMFARLERTEEKELDGKTAMANNPAAPDVQKAMQARDAKAKLAAFKEIAEKHEGKFLGYFAAGQALQAAAA